MLENSEMSELTIQYNDISLSIEYGLSSLPEGIRKVVTPSIRVALRGIRRKSPWGIVKRRPHMSHVNSKKGGTIKEQSMISMSARKKRGAAAAIETC